MTSYKDADAILAHLPDDLPYKAAVRRVLLQAPAADVVEVVRCKDCVYSRNDLDMSGKAAPWLLCKILRDEMFPLMVAKTDYCCWAERKEDEG